VYTGPCVPWDQKECAMTDPVNVERVQLGVRLEKRLVKVLKGLAEFNGVTLGQLLERIVLHSFEAVPGQEGEAAASPHGRRALEVIGDLKRIYGMDYDAHAARGFREPGADGEAAPAAAPQRQPEETGR
jgi:hypothetical protein